MLQIARRHTHLNWRVITTDIVAEPWGVSVEVVQDPSEEIRLSPQAGASPPHHLRGVLLQTLVQIIIVKASKEQTIESHLESHGVSCDVM